MSGKEDISTKISHDTEGIFANIAQAGDDNNCHDKDDSFANIWQEGNYGVVDGPAKCSKTVVLSNDIGWIINATMSPREIESTICKLLDSDKYNLLTNQFNCLNQISTYFYTTLL